MEKVYIVAAKRSPIGSFLGTLSKVSPARLAEKTITGLLNTIDFDPVYFDEVILGNVLSAGHGQGIARQAALKAGIPESVPAYSINMLCGSGMKSVMTAYSQIRAGEGEIFLVGGVESMSQAPFVFPADIRSGRKMGEMNLKDTMVTDGLWDPFNNCPMGMTAENIAEKHGISQEEQDIFAYESHKKTQQAFAAERFDEEITPVKVKIKREIVSFAKDEYPNGSTTLEKLALLRPAFKEDGTVTAGNASGINDGAAFLIVASAKKAKEYNLPLLAEITAVAGSGINPAFMGLGPVAAAAKALEKASLTLKEIDLIELNEAFAAQAIGVLREWGEEHGVEEGFFKDRLNVNGGAIALGHPIGASGARILVTLVHEMIKRRSSAGLASLCIGGGMGSAVIIKCV